MPEPFRHRSGQVWVSASGHARAPDTDSRMSRWGGFGLGVCLVSVCEKRSGSECLCGAMQKEGIYFCFLFFLLFPLLAFWLLGFLAFRLLGFLAFRLLGFLASRLLGFSAFCWFMQLLVAFSLWLFASFAFPVPLRQVAFWLLRLCSFWRLCFFCILCFHSSSLGILAFAPF